MHLETDGISQVVKDDGSHVGMAVVVDDKHIITCAHVINQARGMGDYAIDKPDKHIAFSIRFLFPTAQDALGHVVKWGLTDKGEKVDLAVLEIAERKPADVRCAVFSFRVATGKEWKAYGQHRQEAKPSWTTEAASNVSSPVSGGLTQLDGVGVAGRWIDHGDSGAAVWCTSLGAAIGMVATKHPDSAETRISCMIPANVLGKFWPLKAAGAGSENAEHCRRDEIAQPPEGSVEPPLPTRFFTGRGDVLQQLDRAFKHNSTVALSGMPGVGKTQIALQYARSHKGDYQLIFWAVAAGRDTLAAGYAAIAWRLDLPEKSQKDQTLVNNAARRWLREHEGWLLILDNADDLETIQALLPPSDHRGHLLLTTRESAFFPEAEPVPIKEMPDDDGATFLLRRARRLRRDEPLEQATAEDQAAARAITVELGGLPLALEHAGAYIAEIPIEPADFVNHYREERGRLLRERGRFTERDSVEVTFAMAFERVQAIPEHGPAAAELLRLCAMLAPVAIPETIVTEGAPDLGDVLGPVATSPVLLDKTIAAAGRLSLLGRDSRTRTLRLHRLVQAVLQETLDTDTRKRWAERAVRAVNQAFPGVNVSSWPLCNQLLPHALACAGLIERHQMAFHEAARLLNQVGYYLKDRAQYVEAEPLYRRALKIWERVLGPDHPVTASSLNNLALLYQAQGKLTDAEPLHRRALEIRERVLGPDHPDTALSLNNLAGLYQSQGKLTEAEPRYRRALEIFERVLGPDHPQTALSLNNLAELFRAQGKLTEAEPLLRRALEIRERVLGPDHPNTALSLNNLAGLYQTQGKLTEAEPRYRRALEIFERVLGPDHPQTATSLNNLAGLYYSQGKLTEAEPLYHRALEIFERVLGPDHPTVATVLENLALMLKKHN